ncbi:MAG: SbcC/MukB-like Walker B domain-containing protein [Pseudomonadota bacterium]
MQRSSEASEAPPKTGFRLHRFEVLNWGTFHHHVWHLAPEGANSLLTGDIGSGKSTLVDGLTTLLVSPQKIVYNKAAGAETRERNLQSYVAGFFKSEKDSDTLAAKSVALRGENSFSVLSAHFYNEAYRQSVTLAQVFWSREQRALPERFFLVASKPLPLSDSFGKFGADILELKKRLRKETGVKLFDSFSQYATEFRRKMGIETSQALELFYQTVSMKSVGNLTDFVRRHMLEAPPVQERIEKICRQFDDLNNAHEAVIKARRQVEGLQPIADLTVLYRRLESAIAALREGREALHAFFAAQKIGLLDRRLSIRKDALTKMNAYVGASRVRLDALRTEQRRLDRAISESGGRRLEEICTEIERLSAERRRISDKAATYRKYCLGLKMDFPSNEASFIDNKTRSVEWRKKLAEERDDIMNRQVELKVQMKEMSDEMAAVSDELTSLKARKTNIPLKNLSIRQSLCAAVGISENELPFAGELIRIREKESAWAGVAERLLHGFGLSLLVPSIHYATVAQYADATHLSGRLVYFKTSAEERGPIEPPGPASLLGKLEIKPGTPFLDWLERELSKRFDYVCCETVEDFRRRNTAVTLKGQIKSGGVRHEKDDRHRIDDRARFVLGWNNQEKIEILEAKGKRLQTGWDGHIADLHSLDQERKKADAIRDVLQNILSVETFAEIHWQPLAGRIEQLEAEKQQIEKSSDVLRTLQEQLEGALAEIRNREEKLGRQQANLGKLEEGIEQDNRLRQSADKQLSAVPAENRARLFPALSTMQPEAIGDKKITIENCDAGQTRMRDWLQRRIDNEGEKSQRLTGQIIRRMQAYKSAYPVETREVDAAIEAMDEFGEMLAKLKREDLPRHEQRFKTMLNEGTIQNIALFQAKLDKELSDIRDKIDIINRSLSSIDYDDGTFITLVADPGPDAEIRQFKEDLRACLGDTLTGKEDEAYTEHKFVQVKAIIDRFNGRQGQSELDKRWTQKVTDVRNWLVFSVSERWREDNREKEFYSDTAGKSGGQKEKLAYTILASALAYQFGLKWGETKSRSLRFVMIDEAFGRGSDESTRYALELFSKLNLQLLIVTPLQKINIIEDYVKAVHYIHNEGGKNSMVRNLTIEQYREEKAAFQETAA